MNLPIIFRPEAREEFDEDANWYENRQPGRGLLFTKAVMNVLERIALNPRMHAIAIDDIRKSVVSGYPYCVYYREAEGNLVILSVFHTSRDPHEWQKRV